MVVVATGRLPLTLASSNITRGKHVGGSAQTIAWTHRILIMIVEDDFILLGYYTFSANAIHCWIKLSF